MLVDVSRLIRSLLSNTTVFPSINDDFLRKFLDEILLLKKEIASSWKTILLLNFHSESRSQRMGMIGRNSFQLVSI